MMHVTEGSDGYRRQGKTPNMFKVVLRTAEEKHNHEAWWGKPDEIFFGSGACHILAATFLSTYPDIGFKAIMLKPENGFRGGHVLVTNGEWIFDCNGWHQQKEFLEIYSKSMNALQPGWQYSIIEIDKPDEWHFCRTYYHRHPSQFMHDPLSRAKTFLLTFAKPLPSNPKCY